MAALTQVQRIALAPAAVKDRFKLAEAVFDGVARFQVNDTFLGKSDPDAITELRKLLEEKGVHNYVTQPLGQAVGGVLVPTEYLQIEEDGSVSATSIQLSLYKSDANGRGHRRFNLLWGGGRSIQEGDYLAFVVSEGGDVLILNATRMLDGSDSAGNANKWMGLLESAMKLVGKPTVSIIPPDAMTVFDAGQAPTAKSSAGFLRDVELRKKVEAHSVERASHFYSSIGASDIETLGKPYDLRVQMPKYELHVEVKGSRSLIDSVFVTRNEVAHARLHMHVELLVVDAIKYNRADNGVWELHGGRLRRWQGWWPDDAHLRVEQYTHTLTPASFVGSA